MMDLMQNRYGTTDAGSIFNFEERFYWAQMKVQFSPQDAKESELHQVDG